MYVDEGYWKGGIFIFNVQVPEDYNNKVCVCVCRATDQILGKIDAVVCEFVSVMMWSVLHQCVVQLCVRTLFLAAATVCQL